MKRSLFQTSPCIRFKRLPHSRLRMKCDGTRAENRFRLSAKRTSPFKSAGASVQSTTGSRGVRISGSNAGCTMFRGSVKSTGYPLSSPVSPSLLLPCVTVCHRVSTGLYTELSYHKEASPWRCLQLHNKKGLFTLQGEILAGLHTPRSTNRAARSLTDTTHTTKDAIKSELNE